MEVVLNIGLARAGKPNLTVAEVLHAANWYGLPISKHVVLNSDTEPTIVARALVDLDANTGVRQAVWFLARALDQDCIATYNERAQMGFLAGPRAAAWGEFNPEFFIMPDGTRLASPAAKAA